MSSRSRNILVAVTGLAIFSVLVSACASGSEATEVPPTQEMEEMDEGEHKEEEEHLEEEEHEEGMEDMDHGVPEDAAAIPNPIAADDDSQAVGAEIYATNCSTCHGEAGEGDGPAAAGLEEPPADLHEEHVQVNTDGALFYIITHGRPDTPMPAWEDVLTEDQRWHVVNFLRTFSEN